MFLNAFSIDASSSMSIWMGTTSDLASETSPLSLEMASSAFSRERLPIRMVCGCGEAYRAFTVSYPMPVLPPVMKTIEESAILCQVSSYKFVYWCDPKYLWTRYHRFFVGSLALSSSLYLGTRRICPGGELPRPELGRRHPDLKSPASHTITPRVSLIPALRKILVPKHH